MVPAGKARDDIQVEAARRIAEEVDGAAKVSDNDLRGIIARHPGGADMVSAHQPDEVELEPVLCGHSLEALGEVGVPPLLKRTGPGPRETLSGLRVSLPQTDALARGEGEGHHAAALVLLYTSFLVGELDEGGHDIEVGPDVAEDEVEHLQVSPMGRIEAAREDQHAVHSAGVQHGWLGAGAEKGLESGTCLLGASVHEGAQSLADVRL